MPGINDALRRVGLSLSRGIIHAFSDSPKLQTVDFRGLQNELITGAENFAHPFGHYAVPVPPDEQSKAAEVIMSFLGGNRSLPAILAHIDRRFRRKNGENGQIGHYHYQGATGMYRSSGYTHDAGPNKKPNNLIVGKTSVQASDGAHMTQVGGTTVLKEDGQITTDVLKKLFTGTVHLGAGGSLST